MSSIPRVSVVIPTYHRPDLVVRAIQSALAQSIGDLEVVAIVDGPDDETQAALSTVTDSRLRVIVAPERLGNAGARNAGVTEARARWVAFLDDDDLWMPAKLERQLAVAEVSGHRYPVVACKLIGRSESQDFHWPRRLPRLGEPLSEYLFCRSTPYAGEGLIVTSTIFTARDLLLQVPFDDSLPRYVDIDWLLRADALPGSEVRFVQGEEPLAVCHIERGRSRLTNVKDWEFSLAYARRHRHLFTDRSYAAFLLHVVSHTAGAQHAYGAWLPLLLESVRQGRPALVDLLSHVGNFLVPNGLRRRIAERFARRRRGA